MSRILIVDEDRLFSGPAALVLRNAGDTVDCVASGEQAIQILQSVQPDLILLDLRLPGMSGLSFLRRLRADDRWSAIPVVVVSASADSPLRAEALELEARGCLVKGCFS